MVVVDRTLSIFDVLEVDVFWKRVAGVGRMKGHEIRAHSLARQAIVYGPFHPAGSPYSLIPVARSARSFGIVLEISLPSICLLAISRA